MSGPRLIFPIMFQGRTSYSGGTLIRFVMWYEGVLQAP